MKSISHALEIFQTLPNKFRLFEETILFLDRNLDLFVFEDLLIYLEYLFISNTTSFNNVFEYNTELALSKYRFIFISMYLYIKLYLYNMPHIEMNPINGIFIKCAEISLFYPLYAIINYQHINATGIYNSIKQMKSTTGFYRGIHFNLLHLPTNKFIDLQIYKHYDSSFYAALLSSTFKMLTYPLSTCEVYYLLNNKLPRKSMLYNGFEP